MDDLTFTFIEGSDPTCLVDVSLRFEQKKCCLDPLLLLQAYSQSETLSLLDYGTNYCNLFNYILSSESPVKLVLPDQWQWEIIDEFIYQFQAFSQFRSKLSKKTDDEIDNLKRNPKVWNVHSVLNVLHSLVDKSNINKQLEVYNAQGNPDAVAGDFGRHSLYKMLGYFSLVGLLRLHSLLGDYYQAIKVLENIELNKKSLYSRVPGCQITTYYYVG